MDAKQQFFTVLKEEFFPYLRSVGFKGSGAHFRRNYGPVIHALNIQGDRYGDGCFVNLGIHLEFLPVTWSGTTLPRLQTIKEIDCEFRKRLGPDAREDYRWEYRGGLLDNTARSARNLIDTYQLHGEPLLQQLKTLEALVELMTAVDIEASDCHNLFGGMTSVRVALTLARIYNHLGQEVQAAAYARQGLKVMGRATALKAELEKLAHGAQ